MKVRHRQLAVGRLTLHVAEVGEGDAVLFLHGFPAYWQDWEEQLLLLAERGYRAIAVDLPGHGESEKLVILNAPHPAQMARALRDFEQLRRS